jgi:arsenite methyltransferase
MAELIDIRETVRERYASAAKAAAAAGAHDEAHALESEAGCCGGDGASCSPATTAGVFGASLYDEAAREEVPDAAVSASLGCGVPTAVAELRDGETVLDLGSGAGADVLISARRVAPTGKAIGLDMTDEMLALARANAATAGVANVEFVKGYLEDMPLEDATVDVVISNCVINLSGDKPRVLREAARVLRPGGRFAVSDVIADADMDDATKADMAAWTGCIAGALTEAEFRSQLEAAGFTDVEIRPTHRVHEYASSAIVSARKPAAGCCDADAQTTCCEPADKADCCGEDHAAGSCGCAAASASAEVDLTLTR